jgi:hypothetical protein
MHSTLYWCQIQKYMLKKWWSHDMVEMPFPTHLVHTYEFSGGQQTAGWFSEKAKVHKSKLRQTRRIDWSIFLANTRQKDECRDAEYRQAA